MFAGGLVSLSALLLLQANSQVEAGARVESRTGVAPTGLGGSEQGQVLISATPIFGLRWFDHVNDLQVASATRILWRPVPFPDARPLFLETLTASHLARPSRRNQWRLNLQATYGEQDYTWLSQQFSNQPQLATSTRIFTSNGSLETSWRSSRRTTLTFQVAALHQRPLDIFTSQNTTSSLNLFLPTQTTVSGTPAMRYVLSRLSVLEAAAAVTAYDIQKIPTDVTADAPRTGEMKVVTAQPQLGLSTNFSRRHQLHWTLGFTYADEVRSPRAGVLRSPAAIPFATRLPWHPVTPLVLVELNSLLSQSLGTTVRSAASLGTNWYLDPVLDAGAWHGVAQARIDATLRRRWGIGAHAALTSDITGPTIINSSGGQPIYPDETIFSAEVPVTYRWTNLIMADFGARYVARAPHLSAPKVVWHNQEVWLYLSLYVAAKVPARPS
jgi:hypothetical protein